MRVFLSLVLLVGMASVCSAQWFYQPIEHNPVYRGRYMGPVYPSHHYGGYYGGGYHGYGPIEVRVSRSAIDPLGPGIMPRSYYYGRGW